MSPQSLADRYAALAHDVERRPRVALVGAQPTEVHRRAVHLMVSIMDLADSVDPDAVPAPLRAMTRMLRRMEDELVVEFATVPEDKVRQFMRELAEKIAAITGDLVVVQE